MELITISGNVGNASIKKVDATGKEFFAFSVAVKRGWGDNEKTIWYNCAADVSQGFDRIAKIGNRILVVGEVKNINANEKNEIQYYIKATNVHVLYWKKKDPNEESVEQYKPATTKDLESEDIPF